MQSRAFYNFLLRVGPLIESRPALHNHKAPKSVSSSREGFGCVLSLGLPPRFGATVQLKIYLLYTLIAGSTKYSMGWDLGFPRVIAFQSKVFLLTKDGDTEGIKTLFSARLATPKDTTAYGTTLLHVASRTRNVELIRLLIQEGADVNALNQDGQSPLHEALALEDNYDIARLLIENGADLANKTTDNKTPLHTFFTNTVSQIMGKTDWIEGTFVDSEGMSITHFIARSSRSTVADFRCGRSYDMADLWATDSWGRTCLHLAAYRGNLAVLGYLLQQASLHEVRRIDSQGLTPLHYAVRSGKAVSVVEALLAKGGCVSARDKTGANVLHHAARWNNIEVVKHIASMEVARLLLTPDNHGRMPSAYITSARMCAVQEYLLNMEAIVGPEWHLGADDSPFQSNRTFNTKANREIPLPRTWAGIRAVLRQDTRILARYLSLIGMVVMVLTLVTAIKAYRADRYVS